MLGPVFYWELIRSARRPWHWWLRGLYCGLLFLFLLGILWEMSWGSAGRSPQRMQPEVGAKFYRWFSLSQLYAVLLFAPLFAASSLVEEKTRRTLVFLLTSPLRDVEIVLGKLVLCVLRVWEVVLCGLPFCGLCWVLGGVRPETVVADFVVSIAAAWAGCALAIFASVWSRRLVEALVLSLCIELVWYSLPLVDWLCRNSGVGSFVPSWVNDLNAFEAAATGASATNLDWMGVYGWCLVASTLFGVVLSGLACWMLRAGAAAFDRAGSRSLVVRLLQKPLFATKRAGEVWDRPVLWRELRGRRRSAVDRIVVLFIAIIAISAAGTILAEWQNSVQAIQNRQSATVPIVFFVCVFTNLAFVGFLALPYAAVCGATAFAEERDGQMFDFLRSTSLEQREVVNAKCARLCRVCGYVCLLPLSLALTAHGVGWTTLEGLVFTALNLVAATLSFTMIGLWFGLRCARVSQAVIGALLILVGVALIWPTFLAITFPSSGKEIGWLMFSPPVHSMLMPVFDNRCEWMQSRPPGVHLLDIRLHSMQWTIVHSLSAWFFYRSSLRPLGPWAENEFERSWVALHGYAPQGHAVERIATSFRSTPTIIRLETVSSPNAETSSSAACTSSSGANP